jgi:hypothetical protein
VFFILLRESFFLFWDLKQLLLFVKSMGSIVFIDGGTSAVDKETIVNTRANKLRAFSSKFAEARRNSASLGLCPLIKNCHRRTFSVKFVGVVHERRYYQQEAPASPSFEEVDCYITDYTRLIRHGRCGNRTLLPVKRGSCNRKRLVPKIG